MISVIVYGRNDSHGYNLPKRTAISFNCIAEVLTHLPDLRRKIILLRYFRDMSQEETARALGLTQVKVSREEKKILAVFREALTE